MGTQLTNRLNLSLTFALSLTLSRVAGRVLASVVVRVRLTLIGNTADNQVGSGSALGLKI